MSTREYATDVFNSLNDDQLIDFIKLFANDNMLALVESEIIAKNPNRKHYDSFADILKEIDEELNNE